VTVTLVLAILLNIKSFGLAVLTVVGLLVAMTLLYRHPTRLCHQCGRRVRLDQRVCRHCGYDFGPVRMTR
jgi:predicted amidophosphoribosyltransferase